MQDIAHNQVTASNLVSFATDFSITAKFKYDVKVFGFSLTDALNWVISWIVTIFKYILEYMVTISGNILDLVSMFFYDYQNVQYTSYITLPYV